MTMTLLASVRLFTASAKGSAPAGAAPEPTWARLASALLTFARSRSRLALASPKSRTARWSSYRGFSTPE